MTKQIGVTELKPCPFCGSVNIQTTTSLVDAYAYCAECGISGPSSGWKGNVDTDDAMMQRGIDAWNTRDTAQRKADFETIEKGGILKALEMLREYAIDYSASTNYLSDGIELLENFLGIKKEHVDYKEVL